LARLLQGNALEVYQHLTDEEVEDYEVLKLESSAIEAFLSNRRWLPEKIRDE